MRVLGLLFCAVVVAPRVWAAPCLGPALAASAQSQDQPHAPRAKFRAALRAGLGNAGSGLKESFASAGVNWRSFRSEVREQGVFRWIVREGNPDEAFSDTKLRGLLTPSGDYALTSWWRYFVVPSRLLQLHMHMITDSAWGRPYDLTPGRFLWRHTGLATWDYASQKLTGKIYRPTLWLAIPGFFLIAPMLDILQPAIDTTAEIAITHKKLGLIEEHIPEYLALIEYYHAYADLRAALVAGKMDARTAALEAYARDEATKTFLILTTALDVENPEHHDLLLGTAATAHIAHFIKNGIPRLKSYRYLDAFSPKISTEQIQTLLYLNQLRYLFYQYADDRFSGKQPDFSPKVEFESMVQESAYCRSVLKRMDEGVLSRKQAVFAIQKHWANRIELIQNKVLHIEEMIENADGSYGPQPFELRDFDHETESILQAWDSAHAQLETLARRSQDAP